MFPGHPYLRQETNRVEREERDRVLRLIREARTRISHRRDEEEVDPDDLLAELEGAVRQGHQRFVPRNIRPKGDR